MENDISFYSPRDTPASPLDDDDDRAKGRGRKEVSPSGPEAKKRKKLGFCFFSYF